MVQATRGMVVAPQPYAVEEGVKVLQAGGNAFDAAIATAFCQMVVDPQMCGVAGFGCLTLYDAGRDEAQVIDFNATAGANATPEMWADRIVDEAWSGYGWILKDQVNDIGYGSIATPGTVAGLAELHRHHASLPWSDLIQPAIRLAREGYLLGPELLRLWLQQVHRSIPGQANRIGFSAEARRIYLNPDGSVPQLGTRIRNPEYAAVLERVATSGPEAIYHGEIAERMIADIAANGGTVTLADLASYRPRVSEPVTGSYLGYDLATNPAPGGGPTVLGILNILEGYDLAAMGFGSMEYVYTVARAQAAAMADRQELVGDPAFVEVPTDRLVSKERAAEWRARLDAGERVTVPRYHPDSPTTTNVSVSDRAGNCIALTHTLGSSNGTITPGLGFMYNNAMNCFDPRPGMVNSITPGKARITGICPTIAFKNGMPVLVLGAPGGTRIMTGVQQAIVNVLAYRMSAVEAVSAPRVDCQSDMLDGEARIPSFIRRTAAERAGLTLLPNPAPYGNFALVQAITIDPETGMVAGGADPRSGGAAMGDDLTATFTADSAPDTAPAHPFQAPF